MKIEHTYHGAFSSFQTNRDKLKHNLVQKKESPKKDNTPYNKKAIAATVLCGAILPVVAINLAKGRGGALVSTMKSESATFKNKAKAVADIFEIDKFKEVLASTTGGIAAGVIAGTALDKNPENKKEKYKEGVFEFLNNMIPTTFVATGEHFISKYEKSGGRKGAHANVLRAGLIVGSVVSGMFVANKASNKINEKVFDKDEEIKTKRNFKVTDCLVHLDDLTNLFVLSKNPIIKGISKKFHMDKILPLLYARSGYEAGCAEKKKDIEPKK